MNSVTELWKRQTFGRRSSMNDGGMKQKDVSIPYDVADGKDSIPTVTRNNMCLYLLIITIFKSVCPGNLKLKA